VPLPLFAYGTLRDAEYQRELFGRTYPMREAHIRGFVAIATETGYLAAVPRPSGRIDGALVDLDALGYEVADAWEDRAVYDRIEIEAIRADGGPERAFIYVRAVQPGVPAAQLGDPVTDGRLANRPRAAVIDDIRGFRTSVNRK